MKNNGKELIESKQGIFSRIRKFFSSLFVKRIDKMQEKIKDEEQSDIKKVEPLKHNDIFISNDIKERQRIYNLMTMYDRNELNEDDIPEDDVNKMIMLYEEETRQLEQDTEIRKNRIIKMLKR